MLFRQTVSSSCMRLLLVLVFTSVGGSFTADAQSGVSINTGKPKIKIINPGVVAVDALARRKQLEAANALFMCPMHSSGLKVSVLNDLKAPKDYGLDARYYRIGSQFRRLGASCLGGSESACEEIKVFALDWARHSKLGRPKGRNKGGGKFWNDTLTINMALLSPMLSALGVAEQFAPLSSENRRILNDWLKRKIKHFQHGMRSAGNYKGGKYGTKARKAAHNHAVQSSIVAMSYGAWANKPKYFKTGIDQWFITLKSMREDGSLPIETRRGARALFYHGRTIAGMLQLAERATAQGIDLYDRAPSPKKSIHNAVAFFIDSIEQPDLVLKYARTNFVPGPSKNWKFQDLGGSGSLGSTMGWIAPYLNRFPNHPNSRRLMAYKLDEESQPRSYLTGFMRTAVRVNGYSSQWIGVDARCFYAAPQFN